MPLGPTVLSIITSCPKLKDFRYISAKCSAAWPGYWTKPIGYIFSDFPCCTQGGKAKQRLHGAMSQAVIVDTRDLCWKGWRVFTKLALFVLWFVCIHTRGQKVSIIQSSGVSAIQGFLMYWSLCRYIVCLHCWGVSLNYTKLYKHLYAMNIHEETVQIWLENIPKHGRKQKNKAAMCITGTKSKVKNIRGCSSTWHWAPLCTAKISEGVLHNICISN